MNFNPQGQQSLLDLIGGLKAGMDPAAAYGIYQDVAGEQAQRLANRQQRLAGLSDLLSQTAMAGMPYSGAQALAQAAPGPAGPAVQQMLDALYPTGGPGGAGVSAPDLNYLGNPMDSPVTQPGEPGAAEFPGIGRGAQAVSPTFQPQPLSPTEAQAAQEMQAQQANGQALQSFAVDASKKAQEGVDMRTFLQSATQYYPELFSSPEGLKQVQQIALTVFNPAAGAV